MATKEIDGMICWADDEDVGFFWECLDKLCSPVLMVEAGVCKTGSLICKTAKFFSNWIEKKALDIFDKKETFSLKKISENVFQVVDEKENRTDIIFRDNKTGEIESISLLPECQTKLEGFVDAVLTKDLERFSLFAISAITAITTMSFAGSLSMEGATAVIGAVAGERLLTGITKMFGLTKQTTVKKITQENFYSLVPERIAQIGKAMFAIDQIQPALAFATCK